MNKQVLNPRKVFSKFATGVCILLYKDITEGTFRGLTINSFSSLSLDPLLVTFSLKINSIFLQKFKNISKFSINILNEEQVEIARLCCVGGGGIIPEVELESQKWSSISKSMASLYCSNKNQLEAGDHTIFICNVLDMFYSDNTNPLLFFNSQFTQFVKKEDNIQ